MATTPTQFFKVIRRPFSPHLSIPKAFLRYLNGGRRRSKATLTRRGDKWAVEFTGGRFSGDGWRKCVKDNGIQKFDIIIFEHLGNMVFDFSVFDLSSCEKEPPNLSDEMDVDQELLTESQSEEEEEDDDYDDDDDDDDYEEEEKRKKTIKNQSRVKKENDSIIQEAIDGSTSNYYPYFSSTLKSCTFEKWILHLPSEFIRSNGLDTGKIILRNDENVSWEVKLKIMAGRKFYLGSGFRNFVIANELKKGDAFKFELLENEKNKLPIFKFSCKACMVEDDHKMPYFIGKVKSYGVGNSAYLYLPTWFVKRNGLCNNREMILRNDRDRRSWTVQLKNPKRYCYIGRGWKDFYVANGLKKEDRFKFEIVENSGEKLVVNFYIL